MKKLFFATAFFNSFMSASPPGSITMPGHRPEEVQDTLREINAMLINGGALSSTDINFLHGQRDHTIRPHTTLYKAWLEYLESQKKQSLESIADSLRSNPRRPQSPSLNELLGIEYHPPTKKQKV